MGNGAAIIRVGMVEDHDMVRESLVAMLSADDRFDVVGTASTVREFRSVVGAWNPDVILADYRLPDGKGTEFAADTAAPVLLLSGSHRLGVLDEAVRAGCAGFASKTQSIDELARKIVVVAHGGTSFPSDVFRRVLEGQGQHPYTPLTSREAHVLQLLAEANSVSDISEQLGLSPHTVRNHVRSILTKLNARSQLEAVVNAVRAGLLEIHQM